MAAVTGSGAAEVVTRWAVSPHNLLAHAVTGPAGDDDDVMAARCGHTMPVEAGLDEGPRAQVCPACLLMVATRFEQRGALVNAARDAEGIAEWFPDDPVPDNSRPGSDGPDQCDIAEA